jgi:hypothetical protein
LLEQKEVFVHTIHTQKRREVVVLPPEGDKVIALRTLTIPSPAVTQAQLEAVKVNLLRKVGKPVPAVERPMNRQPRQPEQAATQIIGAAGLVE